MTRHVLRLILVLAVFSTVFWASGAVHSQSVNDEAENQTHAPPRNPDSAAAVQRSSKNLTTSFREAATEFAVPHQLLTTIAYAESQFNDHGGEPTIDQGYGLMHLVDNPTVQTLALAAKLTGVSADVLKLDMTQNIRGGAALLAHYAAAEQLSAQDRADLAAWYPVVARYSTASSDSVARLYADDVYRLLNEGVSGTSSSGEPIRVAGQHVEPQRGRYEDVGTVSAQSTDYGPATWYPASTSNYQVANRPTSNKIEYVVIHTVQGTYSSAINWFQNPSAKVSAHYTVSKFGQVTQSVREKDIAWHVRSYNPSSIGIEHEGWIDQREKTYTPDMYKASAQLTCSVVKKYGIPADRNHIKGHVEMPGNDHQDPGVLWDWNYYMSLVQQCVGAPARKADNGDLTVDELESTFTSLGTWKYRLCGNDSNTYWTYATNGSGQPSENSGVWRPNVPRTGRYKVLVHVPQGCGISSTAPYATASARYEIRHANGSSFATIDHNSAETWINLGTFVFNSGTGGYVRLTDLTADPFTAQKVIFFDAVQWVPDTTPPASSLSGSMRSSGIADLALSGAEATEFEVQIRDTSTGSIQLSRTKDRQQLFIGTPGRTYEFRVRATNGFTWGSFPTSPQATLSVPTSASFDIHQLPSVPR